MQLLITILCLILQQDLPSPTPPPPGSGEILDVGDKVGSIAGAVLGLIGILIAVYPLVKARANARSVKKRISGLPKSEEELKESFRYFVPPKCSDSAPPDVDGRGSANAAGRLFDSLDEKISHPNTYRYLILLGDSGMGKTTALLNYFLRHIRRRGEPKFELKFVPLCLNDKAEEMIEQVEEKANTVLILDGLDENELANVDFAEYIQIILEATADFRGVLISCRTHFFPKDEDIPVRTGVRITGDRPAGREPEHCFHRIYLLPFNDQQVKKYLARTYPLWKLQWRKRKQAFEIIRGIRHLTARPMLLDLTRVLVREQKEFRSSYELYEVMVNEWIKREGFIEDKGALIDFSEQLAANLHLNRESRKSEKISEDELKALADECGCRIDIRMLRGRSLLNRDPVGNIKFADPSVLEYLFVSRFFRGDRQTLETEWTEQMHIFHWERVVRYWEKGAPWFMLEPFKLLLEHPRGIDTLVKSHAVCTRRDVIDFPTETWDEFGVSLIAYMIYVAGYLKQYVMFKRVKSVLTSEGTGEKRITFVCPQGAIGQYGEGLSGENFLFHKEAGGNNRVTDYRGEFSEVIFAEGEEVKELPQEVANAFFADANFHWIRRAFRIRTDTGSDIILAFQTTAPVEDGLVDKITRCALALF